MTSFYMWIAALAINVWLLSGAKKVPIGWRGVLTILGTRIPFAYKEGWRLAPFPLGIEPVDTREQILDLGTAEFTTKDGVKVFVDTTATFKITDPYLYLEVKSENIEHGIDEKRTEVLRTEIRKLTLDEVLDIKGELQKKIKDAVEHEDWGIDVSHIVLSKIVPDPKTAEDLALKLRESLQRNGQIVEASHLAGLVDLLMKPASQGGRGLSYDHAYETALFITGKANPKDIKGFSLDAATVEVAAKFLRR